MKAYARSIAVALAFGALSYAPAFANDMTPVSSDLSTNTVVVEISDLDIARPEDAAKLYERLRDAAKDVCSDARRLASPLSGQIARSCANRALDRAVSRVGAPALDAIHNS
jgi:UrcA family protein